MKRLEQILAVGHNMDRFRLLVKDIKREKLVVFFGAGLSLWKEYSSWGYPFKWIQGKVKHYYDELVEYFHGFPADAHIQKSLEAIGQKIPKDTDRNDFLEWGETLQQIIIELGELYNRSIGGFPFSSFNDACAKAFQAEGDPPTMRTPYAIPAIYYLPYLSNLLITTNVDSSFELVCDKIKDLYWSRQAICPDDTSRLNNWDTPHRAILYLHGHINKPSTLVMTRHEYDAMYPRILSAYDTIHGAREILSSVVSEKSILFLGASLQDDRTVEIINYESGLDRTRRIRQNEDLRFFPLTQLKSNGELKQPPNINRCEPLTYSEGVYGEIATLLLYLVRETSETDRYCIWKESIWRGEADSIPDELSKRITGFLNSASLFDVDVIEPAETVNAEPHDIVHYLFEHHSIAQHDKDLGWSICIIQNRSFTLSGSHSNDDMPFSPLHNYPIGDTVYVLMGSASLSLHDEKRISEEIKEWYYAEQETGHIRKNDPTTDNEISLRIRLIILTPTCVVIDRNTLEKYNNDFDKFIKEFQKGTASFTDDEKNTFCRDYFDQIMSIITREIFSCCKADTKRNPKDNSPENTMDNSKEPSLTLTREP